MRKAVLHIVFLLALLSNLIGHAFVANHAVDATAIQKHFNETTAKSISDNDSLYKNDIVIDTNNYDEYDFDDHDAVKEKSLFTPQCFFTATLLISDRNDKIFSSSSYTHINFSRIPRYDYITLRVLRI